MYTLQNDTVSLSVKKLGAEVCSFIADGKERIWQADPTFWAAHGPLLFPIVGKAKDGHLSIGGQDCQISVHGFLSQMQFSLQAQTETTLVLIAQSNAETLKQYPFHFKVIAKYSIAENAFSGTYEIYNCDDKTMPYGFGLHNGFYCLEEGEDNIEDVYLQFKHPVTLEKPSRVNHAFMDFDHPIPLVQDSTKLTLRKEWYPGGPPVMKDIPFHSFVLGHEKRGPILEYRFSDGFKLFNAWHAPDSSFICLEPWTSQCGVFPYASTLEEIETTMYLAANAMDTHSFHVKICTKP